MTHLKSALALVIFATVVGQTHSVITYTMPAKCDQAYPGFDIPGIGMSSAISNVRSVAHCAFMCSNFNGCECYVWNRIAQICYLRSDCRYNIKAVSPAMISGQCAQRKFTFPATCQRQYDRSLWIAPTMPLSNVIINVDTIEECATICSTFDKCECYSYYGAPGRYLPHCYLYRNCQLRGPENNVISGTCTPRTITLPVAPTMKPTPKPTPKPTLKPVAQNSGTYVKCCQQISDFKVGSWQAARDACKAEGDDMATIFDLSQNTMAATACEGASPGCWTGLKSDASGNFAWMDGTAMTYNRFASGEPLIRLNACVYIDPSSQGQWKTATCDTVMASICEVPFFGFAAAVGETATESFSNGWLIAIMCGLVLCCVVVVVPCVILGRIKEGETTPLLTKS